MARGRGAIVSRLRSLVPRYQLFGLGLAFSASSYSETVPVNIIIIVIIISGEMM